jgi:hypothetical protein
VQAYIAAMPGWKRSPAEWLVELIVRTVPDVHKAVKWNQPFYGHEGEGWSPKASKHDEMRYLDIHEDDDLGEDQLVSWIEQASNLPGEKM